MKKTYLGKGLLVFGAGLLLLITGAAIVHAATSITTNLVTPNDAALNDQTETLATTTANAAAGTNDQTFTLGTTTPNTSQTKASRTLTVGSVPASLASTTIGLCVVTYSSATSTDDLNCSDNIAVISLTLHATANSIASALGSTTGITDTGHGALTATSSGATATFTTTGTETSATTISFNDRTSGVVTSTGSTTGVIPVAEVLAETVGGTAEAGDVYNLSTGLGTLSYTTVASDTSATNIATDINTALQATSTYSSQLFTSAASSGVITLTAKTAGTQFFASSTATNRPATAEILTDTVGGTPEVGDIYKLTIPTGLISYTTVASDTSAGNIAVDLYSTLIASSSYSGQVFTATVSSTTNALTFTAKTPGTGFNLATSTTNGSAIAEVVTFTIPSFTTGETYGISINGTSYSATDYSTAAEVTDLTTALAANSAATCTPSGSVITCTAKSAGTAFTYGTSAADYTAPVTVTVTSGGVTGGGGGGGGYNSHTTVTPTVTTTTTILPPPTIGGAGKVTRTLTYLSRNSSVKELQTLFSADPNLHYTSGVTGYFGLKTMAAVEAFQTTYGVVTYKDPGYGMVGPKTRAALVRVYGM